MSPSPRHTIPGRINRCRINRSRINRSRLNVVGVVACGLLVGWLGACGVPEPGSTQSSGSGTESSGTAGRPDTAAPSGAVAAPAPQPAADGPCPYLATAVVESINGQRVGAIRISADKPYPACFFIRGDGAEQLRTWIVVATPEVARATVDAAVPVATSDLAELPGGWSGGSQSTAKGSVYAVTRQDTAVVITTNQPHTLGAKRITERVIAALSQ